MNGHRRLYQGLLWLYPRAFRREFGTDLANAFSELATDLGSRRAWVRVLADLAVTVPTYRMESLMKNATNNLRVGAILIVLLALAVLGVLTGLPALTPAALGLGILIAIAQRSALARALRPETSSARRRRLGSAAIFTAIFATSLVAFFVAIGDDQISELTLVVVNLVGIISLVGAVAALVSGLRHPVQP